MAATAAAIQCKRAPLAPPQTIANGFNHRQVQQLITPAANRAVARRQQNEQSNRAVAETRADSCFNLQLNKRTRVLPSTSSCSQRPTSHSSTPINVSEPHCEKPQETPVKCAKSSPTNSSDKRDERSIEVGEQQQFRPRRRAPTNETNLIHWKSATSSLNLATRSHQHRRTVALSAKSLLNLSATSRHEAPVSTAANTTASTSKVLRSQLQRRQIRNLRQTTDEVQVITRTSTTATTTRVKQVLAPRAKHAQATPQTKLDGVKVAALKPSAARAALLAPKRALSCNQLVHGLDQAPKIAKTAPSSAVTNSRVRQGALFARRQCQLATPLCLATESRQSEREPIGAPIRNRAPHLSRRDTQKADEPTARAAQVRQQAFSRTTRVSTRTSSATTTTTTTTKIVTKTATESISGARTAGLAFKKRAIEFESGSLRRRWSSLESSNHDESSPSSSSSSTLSTDSSCLLLPSALDYLPSATGAVGNAHLLIEHQDEAQVHSGLWRSLPSSLPQEQQQQQQQTEDQPQEQCLQRRRTSEQSDTRQTEPAEERQQQQKLAADEISVSQRKIEQTRDIIQFDQTNPDCSTGQIGDNRSADSIDIVVKQPTGRCSVTSSTLSIEERVLPTTHLCQQPSPSAGCENDESSSLGKLQINENYRRNRAESMVLGEQQNKLVVDSGLELCNRAYHSDGLQPTSNSVSDKSASHKGDPSLGRPSNAAAPEAAAPADYSAKMMISTDQSDNNASNHVRSTNEDKCNKSLTRSDLEIVPDHAGHYQPLGPLQTTNFDRRQQQSIEVADGNQNELTKISASKHQVQLQKTDLINIRQEPISDYYDLEPKPFARGKFAQVKRCIKRDTKECFAAKCIKKRRRSTDIRREILLEIEALKLSYRTSYIVKLYEVYETPNEMILILEMANGGELQRVLDDEESISESHVRRMIKQILEGLVFLHDDQIVHLDLKPQNLLLTKPFPNGDIKLCDFGFSRRITECEIRELCGTPDYTAPEVLNYNPISLNTDMWSLGVVTYVLLTGYSPFGSENKQQTSLNITTCSLDFPSELFDDISEEAIDFVRKLIVLNPSKRLTSREALDHPWFKK